ncbi:AAA family ATPase [Actinobacillus equuli subsp. haemolyticus]|uniref:UvrD-helicase domain-containing protein n=1 Tax=Actinobacillus equuli TaxID=718 RepID=UPI0024412A5B|nr:UvrD-helicase domain-containing protein [Actinobacillus equuli]WGE77402.1 AAA family ATPase [Actinobacillus equuli subsp. haemolyticus]
MIKFILMQQEPLLKVFFFLSDGSGKTRTLVTVLQKIKENHKNKLITNGQKVCIITFTNAACNEINHRLQYDQTFNISTIHSFAWDLIKNFTNDIKIYLRDKLEKDISDLEEKFSKARTANSKENFSRDLEKKKLRLNNLANCHKFIYSPTEILVGKDTLNHSEVISICANFLTNKPLMQAILVSQYPILFIDECQDTQKDLLISLLETQKNNKCNFCLGLFGDLMQRIYSNGYAELVENLPDDWEKPLKEDNYRCPKRVVELINTIGSSLNNSEFIQQISQNDTIGLVRLFILKHDISNKLEIEQKIREQMASISKDNRWEDIKNVKTLVLEHSMAAKRSDFDTFFSPLSKDDIVRDNLLQNTGVCIPFLLNQFLPLVENIQNGREFEIMRILEKYSLSMNKNNIMDNFNTFNSIMRNFSYNLNDDSSLEGLLRYIYQHEILELPDDIKNGLNFDQEEYDEKDRAFLWHQALKAQLKELKNYASYVKGELGFDTHQGVKGLEFSRVMAILDDNESKGFLFKYNKLLRTEPLSDTDKTNIQQGKDSVLTRTTRLFYVVCSRAKESLAVVVYSNNPEKLKCEVIQYDWFTEEEIIIL